MTAGSVRITLDNRIGAVGTRAKPVARERIALILWQHRAARPIGRIFKAAGPCRGMGRAKLDAMGLLRHEFNAAVEENLFHLTVQTQSTPRFPRGTVTMRRELPDEHVIIGVSRKNLSEGM